jgi:hypothetical protein
VLTKVGLVVGEYVVSELGDSVGWYVTSIDGIEVGDDGTAVLGNVGRVDG